MSFLTPLAGLAALAAVLPVAAWLGGRTRVGSARRALGLEAPPGRSSVVRPALAAAGVALLGLAAAQPALDRSSSQRVRTDAQALFVLDTSRSMAASRTPASPTRLDRAVEAAVQLRAAIPQVPSGIATLTDRVLPDLLPVAGTQSFDGVARRAVSIESPPPRSTSVRATTYDALTQIAAGNYFAPSAKRRLVVLLTDGESAPVDAGRIARALPASKGYRFICVRFWGSDESVFDANGKPEAAYRPDPAGGAVLAGLAAANGGRSFPESRLGAASSRLGALAGAGPTATVPGETRTRVPLAPWLVAVALVLLVASAISDPRQARSGDLRLTRQ
ncbi:MAG TPA: vWA domain-containing protein [Gaiellaceae bacterium]|nr:vWA domain-containing protein [Gaiellaceae bacterium]